MQLVKKRAIKKKARKKIAKLVCNIIEDRGITDPEDDIEVLYIKDVIKYDYHQNVSENKILDVIAKLKRQGKI